MSQKSKIFMFKGDKTKSVQGGGVQGGGVLLFGVVRRIILGRIRMSERFIIFFYGNIRGIFKFSDFKSFFIFIKIFISVKQTAGGSGVKVVFFIKGFGGGKMVGCKVSFVLKIDKLFLISDKFFIGSKVEFD